MAKFEIYKTEPLKGLIIFGLITAFLRFFATLGTIFLYMQSYLVVHREIDYGTEDFCDGDTRYQVYDLSHESPKATNVQRSRSNTSDSRMSADVLASKA